MKNNLNIFLPVLILSSLFLISANYNSLSDGKLRNSLIERLLPDCDFEYQFLPRKDTVFVPGDEFISINLKTQVATLFRRKDTNMHFNISSGNDKIPEGMKTAPGIFSVQSKLRIGISKQFDDAELINWIGFNGNTGFHGLRTNGYYNHLGKRPSSHGCVRIGRETGDTLYNHVKVGTPVIVFEEEPARILAFYKNNLSISNLKIVNDNPQLKSLLKKRMSNLYNGLANFDLGENLLLENRIVFRKLKIPVGENNSIASRQQYTGKIKLYLSRASDLTSSKYSNLKNINIKIVKDSTKIK